jgi:amino acid transporter
VLIALIIYGLIVDLGGAPIKTGGFQRLGFLFWRPPYGPFGNATLSGTGSLNSFLGFWSTMGMSDLHSILLSYLINVLTVRSLFSLMGIELLGVAVGEVANRESIGLWDFLF